MINLISTDLYVNCATLSSEDMIICIVNVESLLAVLLVWMIKPAQTNYLFFSVTFPFRILPAQRDMNP